MREQEVLKVDGPGGSRDIGRGAIVNVSSAMGVMAMPTAGVYVASKHAIQGLTKTIGIDRLFEAVKRHIYADLRMSNSDREWTTRDSGLFGTAELGDHSADGEEL